MEGLASGISAKHNSHLRKKEITSLFNTKHLKENLLSYISRFNAADRHLQFVQSPYFSNAYSPRSPRKIH